MNYVLAVHGGAGTIRPGEADEAPYHAGLKAALQAGDRVLREGGSALEAVVAAVESLEECPLFNAGHGSVFTADEAHELDAAVMEGTQLRAGGVAGVRSVRNPVRLAHSVLQDGRCVLLGGEGAERFAVQQGFAPVPNSFFSTERRRAQLHRVRATHAETAVLDHNGATLVASDQASTRFGTVGAVALDAQGHLAAATSTGGMTNKRPGRIGDSPIVGAGVYANDATCAMSATGTGEYFQRACAGHDLHARMRYGRETLDAAARTVMFDSVGGMGGQGGLIALGRDGSLAMPFNSTGMYRGWVRAGEEPATLIFAG